MFGVSMGTEFKPVTDGVDHINCYSRGKTLLGRQLTNMADIPINHPKYGKFRTLEGFWHWVSSDGNEALGLRTANGFTAKKTKYDKVQLPNFQDLICEALSYKIEQNPELKKSLIESTLPLTHYYYYGAEENCLCIYLPNYNWIQEHFEKIRSELQAI